MRHPFNFSKSDLFFLVGEKLAIAEVVCIAELAIAIVVLIKEIVVDGTKTAILTAENINAVNSSCYRKGNTYRDSNNLAYAWALFLLFNKKHIYLLCHKDG